MGEAGTALTRGRIDKRRAILDAALRVFDREGYDRAGVDVIAAEAGVAKATVYNHFGDKETLLRQAFAALSEEALARNLAAVAPLADRDGDLRALLEDAGLRLVRCYCAPHSWTLRRLLAAEAGRFPDLLGLVQDGVADRVNEALADRLARLVLAGRLRAADPALAAEQFGGLLCGSLDRRTRLGTREVPEEEMREVARAAADTFLRAFGTGEL
ncbi:TetR/AcrR family transcriptional regulator [Actinomadura parmotrematis]|uniref:TetR/AcrR family transcriptional regulator n=1 Tax=Actinomadura parmotrematis TaxID=2864039 RepID=A0ABS7FTW3_9ACTN|nr:TetR/AcrR family transcriptional regulator [Actinomadura parmotrematis]MBW8483817.1 TetR/AcrR family transcriptional regulator [Actinomadura parmotrematis]